MSGGIIGLGRQYAQEAMQGFGVLAQNEAKREEANRMIEKAAEERKSSMISSAVGGGAALGPKVIPAAAEALGITSALTGTAASVIPATAGIAGAAGGAGSLALMEAGAAGGIPALASASPALAALGPIGLGAAAAGGIAYLMSEFL